MYRNSYKLIKKIKGYIVLLILFCLLIPSKSKSQKVNFEIINTFHKPEVGLPQNSIREIIQDKNGLIWVSSLTGISIYTGQKCINFNSSFEKPFRIPNGRIQDMVSNNLGVWVLTDINLYLLYYDNTNKKFEYSLYEWENHEEDIIRIHGAYDQNQIYLSINNKKSLVSFDSDRIKVSNNFSTSDTTISQILYNLEEYNYSSFSINDTCVFVKDKRLYYGINYSIYEINDLGTKTIAQNLKIDPDKLHVGKKQIIVGSKNQGICIIDSSEINYYQSEEKGLANNCIFSVYESMDGVIWIGTDGGGLSKSNSFPKFKNLFQNFKENGIEDKLVWDLEPMPYKDKIAIATQRSGIVIWDYKYDTVEVSLSILDSNKEDKTIYSLKYLQDYNRFIVGTNDGLYMTNDSNQLVKISQDLSNKTILLQQYKDQIFFIQRDLKNRKSTLAKTSKSNLLNSNFEISLVQKTQKFNERLDDILFSKHNQTEIFVSGDTGFYKLDLELNIKEKFIVKLDRQQVTEIISISEDKNESNIIWLGTLKNGLLKFNLESKKVILQCGLKETQSIPFVKSYDSSIYNIEAVENGVWFTSSKGISFLDTSRNLKNYLIEHGLKQTEFNSNASIQHQGLALFGGVGGISLVNIDSLYNSQDATDKYLLIVKQINAKSEKELSFIPFMANSDIHVPGKFDCSNSNLEIISLNYWDTYNNNIKVRINRAKQITHYNISSNELELPYKIIPTKRNSFNPGKNRIRIENANTTIKLNFPFIYFNYIIGILLPLTFFIAYFLYHYFFKAKIRAKDVLQVMNNINDIGDINEVDSILIEEFGESLNTNKIFSVITRSKDEIIEFKFHPELKNEKAKDFFSQLDTKLLSELFNDVKIPRTIFNKVTANFQYSKNSKIIFDELNNNQYKLNRISDWKNLILLPIEFDQGTKSMLFIFSQKNLFTLNIYAREFEKITNALVKLQQRESIASFITPFYTLIGNKEISQVELINGVLNYAYDRLGADLLLFNSVSIGKPAFISNMLKSGSLISKNLEEKQEFKNLKDHFTNHIVYTNKDEISLLGTEELSGYFNSKKIHNIKSFKNTFWESEKIHSVRAFTIASNELTFGVLYLAYRNKTSFFSNSSAELALIKAIVKQLSFALEFNYIIERKRKFDSYQLKLAGPFIKSASLLSLLHNLNNQLIALVTRAKLTTKQIKNAYGNLKYEITGSVKELEKVVRNIMDGIDLVQEYWDDKKIVMNKDYFSVQDIIESTFLDIDKKNSLQNRNLVIEPFADDIIHCDKIQIQHVLLNLIKNSIQATKSDTGKISLQVKFSKLYCTIKVIDNGDGIKPEVGDKIFEPYFTLKPGGTGLGLYISRLAIKEHGGELTYNSGKKGTTFKIILPTNKQN